MIQLMQSSSSTWYRLGNQNPCRKLSRPGPAVQWTVEVKESIWRSPYQVVISRKFEDFVQSKVQPGTEIARITNKNRIMAWCGLHLDPDAKNAIKNFEGVEEVEAELDSHYNRALPASSIMLTRTSLGTLHQQDTVSRRAGQWVNQGNADDALVTISQYP
jgi:hypothetical protein